MFIKEKEKPRFIIHTLVVFHFIILGKKGIFRDSLSAYFGSSVTALVSDIVSA